MGLLKRIYLLLRANFWHYRYKWFSGDDPLKWTFDEPKENYTGSSIFSTMGLIPSLQQRQADPQFELLRQIAAQGNINPELLNQRRQAEVKFPLGLGGQIFGSGLAGALPHIMLGGLTGIAKQKD